MRPSILLSLLALLVSSCTRTVSCADEPGHSFCDDGGARDAGASDGGDEEDAGTEDAGPRDGGEDASPSDAGPCGACEASERCVAGVCVECTAETEADDCSGVTPLCDTDLGRCVACRGDEDCDGVTPICAASMCRGCAADTECAERDPTRRACLDTGACVECTATERTACGLDVCDGATNLCSDRPANEQSLCEDCIADDECMAGQVCVPMTFGGVDVGRFCLWEEAATEGPNGDCLTARPYVGVEDVTTVDGVAARVCTLRVTTCPALAQFDLMACTVGMPPSVATDAECGVTDLDDGLCRVRSSTTNRCTVRCGTDDDCLSGFTCNTGATPAYCAF